MTKLKTLIVDDEPLALKLLRVKLNKHPEIEIIAECKNGREAIAATLELAPDLIFLDIQMPGVDGFGVIKKLQTDVVPLVIFVTAYEQYALDAFDVNAVDYILKPIEDDYIDRAINRAIARFNQTSAIDNKARIISAIDSINIYATKNQQMITPALCTNDSADISTDVSTGINRSMHTKNLERKIVIKDRDGITLLKQPDIEWVDAAGDYTCLHVAGVTHIKRCTLKDLLTDLDPEIFKRVHRSTIVNLNYIKKVIPHSKGEYFLQLGEFDQIKVSRNYKEAIKSYLINN